MAPTNKRTKKQSNGHLLRFLLKTKHYYERKTIFTKRINRNELLE